MILPLFAAEIAKHLGEGWRVERYTDDCDDRAILVNVLSKWTFFMSDISPDYDSLPNRIKVTARHYRSDWYQMLSQDTPSMTVSRSKTAEVIAKDIKRRLFPEYETFFNRLEETYKVSDHDKAIRFDAAMLLCESSNGKIPQDRNNSGYDTQVNFGKFAEYSWPEGKVWRFDSEGRLQLDLYRLTPQEADAVIQLLIKMRSK